MAMDFYSYTVVDSVPVVGDGIDLRQDMEWIINNEGHFVLLRRNYQIHCVCYTQQVYKDSNSACPYCLGTGRVNRIERHLGRKLMTLGDKLMIGRQQDTPQGKMLVTAYKFYFQHFVNPQQQDIIYEVSWDSRNPFKPFALIAEYDIIGAIDMRGDRGRIEYWEAHCHSRPFGRQIRESVIRRLTDTNIDNAYPDARAQYDLQWQI